MCVCLCIFVHRTLVLPQYGPCILHVESSLDEVSCDGVGAYLRGLLSGSMVYKELYRLVFELQLVCILQNRNSVRAAASKSSILHRQLCGALSTQVHLEGPTGQYFRSLVLKKHALHSFWDQRPYIFGIWTLWEPLCRKRSFPEPSNTFISEGPRPEHPQSVGQNGQNM